MPPNVLADSNFLFALHAVNDIHHPAARRLAETVQMTLLVPQVVLTEVAFLFRRAGGVPAVAGFLDALIAAQIPLLEVTSADF
ncbi:MAG: hypothetical protein K8S97_00475 [Anaerolineae bacterium]|nr:hypothetical protein [Anaerolineae bacterium]